MLSHGPKQTLPGKVAVSGGRVLFGVVVSTGREMVVVMRCFGLGAEQ